MKEFPDRKTANPTSRQGGSRQMPPSLLDIHSSYHGRGALKERFLLGYGTEAVTDIK